MHVVGPIELFIVVVEGFVGKGLLARGLLARGLLARDPSAIPT
jgi:hypothetical protein